MRVVEVEAVYQQAVRQHRVAQCEPAGFAEHRRLPFAQLAHRGERDARIVERRGRQRKADAVEDQMLRALAHGRRNVVEGQLQREVREAGRDACVVIVWIHRAMSPFCSAKGSSWIILSGETASSEY